MSDSLDPDQDRHSISRCIPKVAAIKERVKLLIHNGNLDQKPADLDLQTKEDIEF